MYYIGYDLGSSSIKAALVDSNSGKSVGITQYPEQEMAILSIESGWAEQDPDLWWFYICEVTKKLLLKTGVKADKVIGIGISYQMHGLVVIDKNHKVLRPSIIWCDSRAVEVGNQTFKGAGEEKWVFNMAHNTGKRCFHYLRR